MSDVTTELAMEASDKAMEVARLKADNAKLREEIEAAKHDLQVFSMRSVQLDAENAKLRELVRLMVRRYTPISPCKNIPCGECPVKDECDQEDALMRELGVEVDG